MEGAAGALSHLGLPQPAVGIRLGRGPDVAPLDVRDDEEPPLLGIGNGALHDLHAPPAQPLIVRRLGLHSGDHVAERVDQPSVELPHRLGGASQRLAILIAGHLQNMGRNLFRLGVQPRDGGISFLDDFFL